MVYQLKAFSVTGKITIFAASKPENLYQNPHPREYKISVWQLLFKGDQFNAYTDVSFFKPVKNHMLVFGFNAIYDQFRETQNPTFSEIYTHTEGGIFGGGVKIRL